MTLQTILQQYDQIQPRLHEARTSIEAQLRTTLSDKHLNVNSISSRVKTRESLKQKIARPDRTYVRLEDVTDVLGFRVITYFEDSIEEIGRLIEEYLNVDLTHSTNKLRNVDQERFGYRSLHYVCSFPEIESLRFEIQIRTILQHAWAEIEHDLGYKSIEGVPGLIRRRFSQVASILEMADREFVTIRREVGAYEDKIREGRVENDANLPLDLISLTALLAHPDLQRIDHELADVLKLKRDTEPFFLDYLLRALAAADLKTSKQVIQAIHQFRSALPKFVMPYFNFAKNALNFDADSMESVKKGYALLLVAHLAVLEREHLAIDKVNHAIRFYEKLDYQDVPEMASVTGRALVDGLRTGGFFDAKKS